MRFLWTAAGKPCKFLREKKTSAIPCARAWNMVDALQQKAEADRAVGALVLGMMGIDPREVSED